MKKLTMCLALAALVMVPFTAFAMDVIADSELDAVTGQAGVDIAVVDFNMDMTIDNIGWGDPDTLNIVVAGRAVSITAGWFNMNSFYMNNLFVTLAGVGTGNANIYADPFKIDIGTGGATSATNPYVSTRGVSGVQFSMPDMLMQIEKMGMNMHVTPAAMATVGYSFNTLHDAWGGTPGTAGTTTMLGILQIDGLSMTTYSSVRGYNASGSRSFTNFPGRVFIMPH